MHMYNKDTFFHNILNITRFRNISQDFMIAVVHFINTRKTEKSSEQFITVIFLTLI